MTTERLELRVNPRPADAFVAIVWSYLRPGPLQLLAATFGLYPALLLAVNMGMVQAGPWPFVMTLLGATLGIYLLCIGLELAVLALRARHETWRKTHCAPHRLIIDDQGLASSSDYDAQRFVWSDLRAVQCGLGYVFVRLRKRRIMPIPLRDLQADSERRSLLNRLQRVATRRQKALAALSWVGVATALLVAGKIIAGLFVGFTLDHQLQNGVRLARKLPAAIEGFRAERGRLPDTLAELSARKPDLARLSRDVYDEPLHYDRRGEAFVLVSYGRDRRKDGDDYWKTRETAVMTRDAAPSRAHFACRNPDADLVVSDRGLHHACATQ